MEFNDAPITIATSGVGRALAATLERACIWGEDTADENFRPAQVYNVTSADFAGDTWRATCGACR